MARKQTYWFSQQVPVSPAALWDVVSDHAGMVQWLPVGMSLLEVEGRGHRDGVGAIRSLTSAQGTLVERVTTFDARRHTLSYELVSGLPLRQCTGFIRIHPHAVGSVFSTEITAESRIPGASAIFGLLMTRLITVGAARFAYSDRDAPQVGSRRARLRHRLTQPAAASLHLLGGAAINALLTIERYRVVLSPPATPRPMDRGHVATSTTSCRAPTPATLVAV